MQEGENSSYEIDSRKYRGYTFKEFNEKEIREIGGLPERNIETLLKRKKDGSKCFGVKFKKKIAAFMWCDYNCFYDSHVYQKKLKKDECYLYDAYTLEDFRGKGLAPFIRYELYRRFSKAGIKRIYSITEYFNKSAVRFKKKLGAKFVELRFFLGYKERFAFSFRIWRR